MNAAYPSNALSEWAWLFVWALVPAAFAALAFPHFFPWIDEVQFVDPGASLALGQGFTSSAWPYQRPDEVFMGNAPAFSALLGLWFKLFGFGWVQARSLSFLFAGLATVLGWMAFRRAAPSVPAWLAGLVVALSCCGYGVTQSVWSVRYDTLGMLLASVLLLLLCRPADAPVPRSGWVLLGAMIFMSGFHLVIGGVLLAAVLYFSYGRRYGAQMFWVGLGVFAGACAWMALLAVHGQLRQFFFITFGSQHTVSGQLAQLVVQGDRGFLNKMVGLGTFLFQDPSWLLLMAALLALVPMAWRTTPTAVRHAAARLTAGLVLLVPAGLYLAGKFPIYYVWMAYIPTAYLLAWWASQLPDTQRRVAYPVVAVLLIAASVLGAGKQLQKVQAEGDPIAYQSLVQWADGLVQADDWVYASFETYPVARKKTAQRVFVSTYGQTRLVPKIPEARQISLMLVRQSDLPAAQLLLGGDWAEISRFNQGSDKRMQHVAMRRSTP